MTSPPHPAAAPAILDAARLEALAATGLLDSPPEDEFDRLTSLTARVTSAPVSLVALIDEDRSYFKSAHGLLEVPEGRTVSLSHSLCQHVVGTGEALVVDDARVHPLVRDNGGVTDLGVGAYLGMPVRSPGGQVLGSLCAIDLEARAWTADDRASLASLATSVENEIALRAELSEREAAEQRAHAEASALAAIVGINARLAAELDPDRLVEAVVDAGVAMTGAAMGAFFYRPVGGDRDALLFASTNVPETLLDAFRTLRTTPEVQVLFAEPTRTGDVLADPAFAWARGIAGSEVRSLVSAPVADASGKTIGTLLFAHPDADAFDLRAERGTIAIADQAAIALQNARLHRALDDSERRLRSVLSDLSDVVFQMDVEGRYTYLNAAWETLTGHAVADTLGRSFLDFAAGDVEALGQRFAESAARASPDAPASTTLNAEVRCADGSVRHLEVRGRVTFDAAGAPSGSAGTLVDITDAVLYRSERDARAAAEVARAEAERMARLQNAFLANMSHEIRTPLTAILGSAEFLAAEAPDDLRDLAGSIHRGGQRLMHTLTSVLDLAQLDAGRLEASPQPTDLRRHLMAAVQRAEPAATAKGLTLYADVPQDLPTLSLDAGLIDRAVANLLDNAVKFTEHGAVALRMRHHDGQAVVEIADTGIGIDAGVQASLFDPFQQASDGHARTHEGNGLGLAIVRSVVRLMGGEVSLQSEVGRGTQVAIAVPTAPVAPERPPHVARVAALA